MHRQKGETKMNERLKILLNTLGLTMREFAQKLNVSTGLIGNWTSGSQQIPDVRIEQICFVFNVRREWLEKGEGEIFKPKRTEDELLQELINTLFDELSPRGQEVFLGALKKRLEIHGVGKTNV